MEQCPRHGEYPDEMRGRAVRLVLDHESEYGSQWEAICSVAEKLGPNAETVRLWVRQAEVDGGRRAGPSSDDLAELKRRKRENAELRQANDILKAPARFFGAELDRQSKRWSPSSTLTRSVAAARCDGGSSRPALCCRSLRRRLPAWAAQMGCAGPIRSVPLSVSRSSHVQASASRRLPPHGTLAPDTSRILGRIGE